MEIKRINFVEREPFRLTYRMMVLMGVSLVLLGFILSAVQWGRAKNLEKQMATLGREVKQLKTDRERLLKDLENRSGTEGGGVRGTLAQLFSDSILWSQVFRELSSQLPAAAWLTTVKTYDKPDLPMKRGLLLEGYSQDPTAISRLLKSLSESSYFEKVILSSFRHETGEGGEKYGFTVDLALSKVRGNSL